MPAVGELPMPTRVKVKKIKPNPFYARKFVDPKSIQALAEEIKSEGLWAGALRGRMRKRQIELCVGHRRLEAIKLLGWANVEIELLQLDDADMAGGSLMENLQREDLDEAAIADGVAAYVGMLQTVKGLIEMDARKEASEKLGIDLPRLSEMISFATELDEDEKEPVREGKLSLRTAWAAHRHGNKQMVKTAAAQAMPLRAMDDVRRSEERIEDPDIKKKVHNKVVAGKLKSGEEIRQEARRLQAKKLPNRPADLEEVMLRWADKFQAWNEELNELVPYREYIDAADARKGKQFREPLNELIDKLKTFR